MFGAFKVVLSIMHFSRLLLVATYVNKENKFSKHGNSSVCRKMKARELHVDCSQGQNQNFFPRGGGFKMFWSLDELFQVRESNMFQMAYKYMYIVNN